jgi:hypothetical protein
MVMAWPAMVTDAVAAGLSGGALGAAVCAISAAANRRLEQASRHFMVVISVGKISCREHSLRRIDCRTGRPFKGNGAEIMAIHESQVSLSS